MANISFVRTRNGWLVLETLMSEECTYAALELAEDYFSKLGAAFKLQGNIKGIIISHSHVDHFGGVKAVCSYNLAGSKALNGSYSYEKLTLVMEEQVFSLVRCSRGIDGRSVLDTIRYLT